ncbi:MAG: GGDEF domain-containing protein [Methylobacterium sp.]|nr:GGDEF domain-containing protein [Methylobacterium sp.]
MLEQDDSSDRVEIQRLKAALASQAAALAHARKIFERASAAARIGVWECALDGEELTWTDVVYDLYDLPRGSALDRAAILRLYTPESRKVLEATRSRAIAEAGGFSLDTEIVTQKGNRRWIRITATVEYEGKRAARIFGMKQDITEEKNLSDRTRYLAAFDPMTGLANRATFQEALSRWDRAAGAGALLLVDLDGFKKVNDTFGHKAGDECLCEAAARLRDTCSAAGLVARIGGDEFAVLLKEEGPAKAEDLARRIGDSLRRPIEAGEMTYRLSGSVGIALRDGSPSETLFVMADTALYAAKAAGRDTFRLYAPSVGQAIERRRRAHDLGRRLLA